MSEQFFITATGTEIGKSFVLQKLAQKYQAAGQKFWALKPVISGFDFKDEKNDSALILRALALENNVENLNLISPWRFKEPASPNVAAAIEGEEIEFAKVVEFCLDEIKRSKKQNLNLLIEGAGGVMTPVNNQFTFLDLIKELKIPVILVIGNYLGTISHSLSAIKVLENSGIKIAKIFLNCQGKNEEFEKNLANLKNFTKIEIEVIS